MQGHQQMAAHLEQETHPMSQTSHTAAPSTQSNVVSIAELEKQAILSTIRQLNGDKLMAARLLGIGKTTLYRKLKEYGMAEDYSLV
jgi:two-component system response regulator HydG